MNWGIPLGPSVVVKNRFTPEYAYDLEKRVIHLETEVKELRSMIRKLEERHTAERTFPNDGQLPHSLNVRPSDPMSIHDPHHENTLLFPLDDN